VNLNMALVLGGATGEQDDTGEGEITHGDGLHGECEEHWFPPVHDL
jgi:hypothetical protein